MTAPSFDDLRTEAPESAVKRTTGAEFVRYFGCSLAALVADYALYSLGLQLRLGYPLAAVIGFGAGLWVAYGLSVRFAFAERAMTNPQSEFVIFAGIGIFGLLLTEALLWISIEKAGLHPMLAKLLTAGAVFASNFLLRKSILFTSRRGNLAHEH